MTDIFLTNEQIEQIRQLAAQAPNAAGNYEDVYLAIAEMLPDSDVKLWFEGAAQANAGKGAFSIIIREYSRRQMELRGIQYSDALMQEASNQVAIRAINDIFSEQRQEEDGTWRFPNINDIAVNDATGVGLKLFASLGDDTAGGDQNAGWSGTVLFTALGAPDQINRLYSGSGDSGMDTLDDMKNVLFAYDAYQHALDELYSLSTLAQYATSFDSRFFDDLGIGIDTFLSSSFSDLWTLAWGNISNLMSGNARVFAQLLTEAEPEVVLDWMRSSYFGSVIEQPTEADNFASAATDFFRSLGNSTQTIQAQLLPETKAEILAQAQSSEAVRNALMSLSPIAVTLPSYEHDLSLLDPESGQGALSEMWLDKRASFMIFQRLYRLHGHSDGSFEMPLGLPVPIIGDVEFADLSTGYELLIDGVDAGIADTRKIVFGSDSGDAINGGDGEDHLFGMSGNDTITGGESNDYLEGGRGADSLSGGDGDDTLIGGLGDDTLSGGEGSDELDGGQGNDTYIIEDSANQVIEKEGQGDEDELIARVDYELAADAEIETIRLEEEAISVTGSDTDNRIEGNDGNNDLKGQGGDDELIGGAGNDTLDGGEGIDQLEGGEGDDTYILDDAEDTVIEAAGAGSNDTLITRTNYDLAADAEIEVIRLEGDASRVTGSNTDNKMYASDAGSELDGADGNDELIGASGVDKLTGGAGTDTLIGGGGADILSGDDDSEEDTLKGGAGYDLYRAGSGDIVIDDDRQGSVQFEGAVLSGGTRTEEDPDNTYYSRDGRYTYVWSGSTLTVNGELTIQNFSNDALGIHLETEEEPDDEPDDIDDPIRRVDPLVLDLDGDGIVSTTALEGSPTFFDLDDDNYAENTGWIAANDGLLAWDQNGNGYIDGINELFGNADVHGFEELRANFDSNDDGVVNVDDEKFSEILIWQDYNQDGASQENELRSITDYSISSINLDYSVINEESNGNRFIAESTFTTDSGEQKILEAEFALDNKVTKDNVSHANISDSFAELTADNQNLPLLRGFGLVNDLHVAYARNPELLSLVKSLQDMPPGEIYGNIEQLINVWTGLSVVRSWGNADPNGALNTADKLWVMEKLNGLHEHSASIETQYINGSSNPGIWGLRTDYVEERFDRFKHQVALKFIAQTVFEQFDGVSFSVSGNRLVVDDKDAFLTDLGDFLTQVTDADTASILSSFLLRYQESMDITLDEIREAMPSDISTLKEMPAVLQQTLQGQWSDIAYQAQYYIGTAGNDSIAGTTGEDYLAGGSGDDVIVGGQGDDELLGGEGNDTYLYRTGDGEDQIFNSDSNVDSIDILRFDEGINPADVAIARSGYNLILTLNSDDEVTLMGYFNQHANSTSTLDRIEFADGTIWDIDYIKAEVLIPTEGNDVIYGYEDDNALEGLAGNDNLSGYEGNDVLDGGTGNDTMNGGTGSDTYLFDRNDGNDAIYNYDADQSSVDVIRFKEDVGVEDVRLTRSGNTLVVSIDGGGTINSYNFFSGGQIRTSYALEQIQFADGTVWDLDYIKAAVLVPSDGDDEITGYDEVGETLVGLAGNDTLNGSDGNDTLSGGLGNDTLNGGSGDDEYIYNRGDGNDLIASWNTQGQDRLRFSDGIAPTDITATRSGNMLILTIDDGSQIRVNSYFTTNDVVGHLEEVAFADGTVWTPDYLREVVLIPTDDADALYGYQENEIINGLAGDDVIYGNNGDDTLSGDAGADTLYGGNGEDTLAGGQGDDMLYGGYGKDTYVFAADSGHDTIDDSSYYNKTANVIQLAADLSPEQITVRRSGNDLLLIVDDNNSLRVRSYFYNLSFGGEPIIEQVSFADGTSWDVDYIIAESLKPTAGDDVISGFDADEVLTGLAGNDTLSGGDGDDTLIGGLGDDRLNGDAGSDVYQYSAGDGHDVITSHFYSKPNQEDTIRLSDLTLEQVTLRRQGSDLAIIIDDSNSITVEGYFYRSDNIGASIQTIEFSDGMILDVQGIKEQVLLGTAANDTLTGYDDSADELRGGEGNDLLYGNAGDDVLEGGAGNDNLYGQSGSDTYLFSAGHGNDVIDNENYYYSGSSDEASLPQDRVRFDETLSVDDIRLARQGDNLVIYTSDTDSIVVRNHFVNDGQSENSLFGISFADGTVWDREILQSRVQAGTEGDDDIAGYVRSDEIDALGGNDIVRGYDGDDLVLGGSGNDSLYGGNGEDRLYGQDDNDKIYGEAGDDLLHAGAGDDSVYGGTGNDTLVGAEGDDQLEGGSGDDLIQGGQGDDIMRGGDGEDAYYIRRGDGNDIIEENDDVKIYVDDLDPESAIFRREGRDLIITFDDASADNIIRVRDYFEPIAYAGSWNIGFGYGVGGAITQLDAEAISQQSMKATERDDVIYGNVEGNEILGLQGNDEIHGEAGDDYIAGDEGNDSLYGDAGNDQLDGGIGDDQLSGGSGNDYLSGGVGNDALDGGDGDDTYVFGANEGNDRIVDAEGNDTLRLIGLTASDVVLRRRGNDLLITLIETGETLTVENQFNSVPAAERTDAVIDNLVFANNETLDIQGIETQSTLGTSNDDNIEGHTGNDNILAGDGDDIVQSGAGDDVIDGGTGNDSLYGEAGNDTLTGGLGQDTLEGASGDDELHGGDDNDQLYGASGDDKLAGDAGDDNLVGGDGDDTLDGGTGDDQLTGGYGDDLLEGGAGNDQLSGGYDNDTLTGSAGDDMLEGEAGSDTLYGGSGDDQLLGGSDYDTLFGGAGDDVLYGTQDDFERSGDEFSGDAGNDTIYGTFGDDTYHFNLGDGQDRIIETALDDNDTYPTDPLSQDTLVFGADITADDLTFYRQGLDLVIVHSNETDVITVENWFYPYSNNQDLFKINQFTFADGSSLSSIDVENRIIYQGSEADDSLFGYGDRSETINGGLGNDYMEGRDGNDQLFGGEGNDQLNGGLGNDRLDGGNGDDKYVYDNATGQDIIEQTGDGYDGLFFRVDSEQLSFSRDNDDLLIIVDNDENQSVRVVNHFLGGDSAIDYIQPASGFSITSGEIQRIIDAQNTEGDFDQVITGDDTDEQLVGSAGKDKIVGNGGADTLFGFDDDDLLQGGAGNDYLSGGYGNGVNSGNDTLDGGVGDDVLNGEDGDDLLIGGAGNDSYVYNANSGIDTIDNSGDGTEYLFLDHVSLDEIQLFQDGDDLVIRLQEDSNQEIRVLSHFLSDEDALEYLVHSGDQVAVVANLDVAEYTTAPSDGGTDNPDDGTTDDSDNGNPGDGNTDNPDDGNNGTITNPELAGDNDLSGGSNNDVIVTGAGDDTLTGNAGNDRLIGGTGNDTYIIGAGHGADTIVDTQGANTIRFVDGIGFSDVASGLTSSGDDLILRIGSGGDQVRISNFFALDNTFDRIEFESGGELTADQIFGAFGQAAPSASIADGDIAFGTADGDQLTTGDSQDVLVGGGGDDTLSGLAGNDQLVGGTGNDVYLIGAGSGVDTIIDTDGQNVIRFIDGISFSEVASGFSRFNGSDDLIINIGANGDQLRIADFFSVSNTIERFEFESGGEITAAQIYGIFGVTAPEDTVITEDAVGMAEQLASAMAAMNVSDEGELLQSINAQDERQNGLTEFTQNPF